MKDRLKKIFAITCLVMILLSVLALPISAEKDTDIEFYYNGDIAFKYNTDTRKWDTADIRALPDVGKELQYITNASFYLYDYSGNYTVTTYKKARIMMVNNFKNVPDSDFVWNVFYPVAVLELFSTNDVTVTPAAMYQIGFEWDGYSNRAYQVLRLYFPDGEQENVIYSNHTFALSFSDKSGARAALQSVLTYMGADLYTRDGYDLYFAGGYYTGYDVGQTHGYQDGLTEGYNEGYNGQDGYPLGYEYGYENGAQQGYADAKAVYDNSEAWKNMKNVIFAMYDAPFYIIQESFDFDIFGINIAGTIIGLISLSIIVFVLSFVIQKFF